MNMSGFERDMGDRLIKERVFSFKWLIILGRQMSKPQIAI